MISDVLIVCYDDTAGVTIWTAELDSEYLIIFNSDLATTPNAALPSRFLIRGSTQMASTFGASSRGTAVELHWGNLNSNFFD